jgi:predicted TIM-barrel fold metal-dependent hydrolase
MRLDETLHRTGPRTEKRRTMTTATDTAPTPARADGTMIPVTVVDCDVHPAISSQADITRHLPERWHHYHKQSVTLPYRFDVINNGARVDSRPADGKPAGSNPALVERQLLDEAGVDFAILLYHSLGPLPHPEADAARNTAINAWQAETWLGEFNHHGRYRGAIRVSPGNPDAALREIERWADHPYFVQVLAVHNYTPAFGHPIYEPIWRACAERGLPVAVHGGEDTLGQSGNRFGPPTYNFEWHALNLPIRCAAHVASLVCSGTLERNPGLRFVMVEGGIGWGAALGGHLDRSWRRLRSEVPELQLAPSEYLRRQVFWSTQPAETPLNPEALLQVYDLLGEDNIMFSTDYPHWDYDDPKRALPRMPKERRQKVMFENACKLYGIPRFRLADSKV